ncbi:AAA family ATPase [Novilysobacter erysipheiresistens]|uniref:AAA family ATPase n=1 Tax=Novilysobacter erysipheiresistens TaxID=1749332 RepID=A0ABU7YW55_9GAMM
MRLQTVEISGFRGFAADSLFDVDADAIVVVGANGNGKTSFYDAILWALTGRVQRLSDSTQRLVNRFSDSGQARVRVRMGVERGAHLLTVTRTFDGKEARISVEESGEILRGPEAEGRLIRVLWSNAAGAVDPFSTLGNVLTRSVYLQQDLISQFIDDASDHDRFNAISELVGAGRITDLQSELERSKAAWSKATNAKSAELNLLRNRIVNLEARLAELRARQTVQPVEMDNAEWSTWWADIAELGVTISGPPPLSRESQVAIDNAMKQLDAERRALERKLHLIDQISGDLVALSALDRSDPSEGRAVLATLRERINVLKEDVREEQARMSKARSIQAELEEYVEQMHTLASIALQHLGASCPVCEQTYDVEGTRRRLELMVSRAGALPFVDDGENLRAALENLSTAESEALRLEMSLRQQESAEAAYSSLKQGIGKRALELGIQVEEETSSDYLLSVRKDVWSAIENASEAQNRGERFALQLSRMGDAASINELASEIATLKQKLVVEQRDLTDRTRTGDRAQIIIETLRESASDVVAERIQNLQPLLTDMYGRVDVHPAFQAVKFLTSVVRGRGRLTTVVSDPQSAVESDAPETVLSSSQLNALAVCTFLSLNMGLEKPPLDAIMLDDPLQSLDDINLLGLIDLLRQAKETRQLFVSTHDARFGSLLGRKLRPNSVHQRTVLITLDGWGRAGPSVDHREIHADPAPMRLKAVAA